MNATTLARRLTTILAADVVRYSELTAIDEEGTVERLKIWRTVIDSLIDKHGGRIFNTAGDAVLAEFSSAVEAVRCAISIQEELGVRNSALSTEHQMWLRIGVNVGDVMVDDSNLLGDGVNIAARMESLSDPGGICISGSAFEHVKNKLSIAFDNLGPQRVKNIPDPVPAYKIVPGDVSVSRDIQPSVAPGRSSKLGLLGTGAIAITIAGIAAWYWISTTSELQYPFDGSWEVSVHSRSGCPNNEPTSYPLTIRKGKIDEPAHRLPKKGVVSQDGRFEIEVSRKDGSPLNKQIGRITGDRGEGNFIGGRQGCQGKVTLTRSR